MISGAEVVAPLRSTPHPGWSDFIRKIAPSWDTSSEQGRDREAFSVDQYVSRTAHIALRALAGVLEPAARVFLAMVHDLRQRAERAPEGSLARLSILTGILQGCIVSEEGRVRRCGLHTPH